MVEFRDLVELEVVHRALMAARFAETASDPVLLGSPYLAVIHSSILDDIIAAYRKDGKLGVAARWDKWRELSKERNEWAIVKGRLSLPEMGWQSIQSCDEKCELVRTCFEPFRVSQALIDEMVADLDQTDTWI
jgi:hypothetical protein